MKTHRSVSFFLFGFAMLALGAGTGLPAQPLSVANSPVWERQTQPSRRGRVQRINPEAESFGMSRMAGRPVRSVNGEQLSTITDFLVEPQTGRVHFAILPSGGGPNGMTYRIVPISAFTGANQDALVLRLDRAHWDRVGTMEESQLGGRVVIDVDHQQRLSRQLGLSQREVYDGHGAAELVRATALRGQSIRSGDGRVGRIEDVVVDVTRHESAVVCTTDQAFAGSEQRYVVPFEQLGMNESGTWMSRLRREDFAPTSEPPPPPALGYGYDSGRDRDRREYNVQPNPPNNTEAAAAAVQQTIERSWARGRVDVASDGRRIILRGLVDTEQERAELERAAAETARGVRIDNQIAVRRR
jgi:sporulation protein YlmC with PRC-barrel domain